jgi:hypothetical protein
MFFLHPGKGEMPQVTNFAFYRYFLQFSIARVMQIQKVRKRAWVQICNEALMVNCPYLRGATEKNQGKRHTG